MVLDLEREPNEPRPAGSDKLHLNPVHVRQIAVQGAEASLQNGTLKGCALLLCSGN